MPELTYTIPAQTCPEAWVKAIEYLLNQPDREAYYLTLAIASPEKMTPNDFRVHDLVDTFLRVRDEPPIVTVAGTIFSANHYLREGAAGVFERFPQEFSKLAPHSWGVYSMRMVRKAGREGTINPLEILVDKLKKHKQRMRAAYEINLTDQDDDAFELPIYQAKKDAKRLRPQPCLSHLTFKMYPGDALTLAVMYRSHFYLSKALGNLLGLAQLQSFIAAEVGLAVGPLICYSTHARLDTAPWNLTDARQLITRCREALSTLSPTTA